MTPNPPCYNGFPICCTLSSKWCQCRNWKHSKVAWARGPGVYAGLRGAHCGYSGYVGEHYDDGGECLWPGRTGLRECVPRIFFLLFFFLCASQSSSRPGGGAESVERSRSLWRCWAFWGCGRLGGVSELQQQRIHRALETTDRFTGD